MDGPSPAECEAPQGARQEEGAPTMAEGEEEEAVPDGTWHCHKCQRRNLPSKARCGNCQAWRGGKREGYAPARRRGAASLLVSTPGEPWPCPCGTSNGPTKVRCGRCQKWRGGRRDWTAGKGGAVLLAGAGGTNGMGGAEGGPWTCDRCGNENGARKVRCNGCPRWRDGKRPAFKKKAAGQSAQPLVATAATAVAASTGATTGLATHAPTTGISRSLPASRPLGAGWLCKGCAHPNASRKKRCGACQRWKFGKRENMLKKNRTAAVPALPPLAGMPPGQPAMEVAHGEGDAALPEPIVGGEQCWTCGCGQANAEGKARCSNCQGWKGGKRGSLPRRPGGRAGGGPGDRAAVHRPNVPWECARCGDENGYRKLRCGTCQSWKNAKKRALAIVPDPDWTCHGCAAAVPGIKRRCPSCRCWKGGVRRDPGKAAPNWTCERCGGANEGRRARCGACQGWRGGHRGWVPGPAKKPSKGTWECERCRKPNGASKARCGGCQRWRGGRRPDLRKANAAERAGVPGGVPLRGPLAAGVPVPPQLAPMAIRTAAAPPLLGQTDGSGMLLPPPPPLAAPLVHPAPAGGDAAKAPPPLGPGDALHWTCHKCTCDNLASEAKCRICDCPRDNLMV